MTAAQRVYSIIGNGTVTREAPAATDTNLARHASEIHCVLPRVSGPLDRADDMSCSAPSKDPTASRVSKSNDSRTRCTFARFASFSLGRLSA